jgi:hypothetical protein
MTKNAKVKANSFGDMSMNPNLGRLMFNFGILVLFLALIPLPFLDTKSPEFIVDVIGLIVSILFLLAVYFDVKRQASLELKTKQKEQTNS